MPPALKRARDGARFVAVTLVLTLAYLGLQQLWLNLVDAGYRAGIGGSDSRWIDEARQLAGQSQAAEAKLPPSHRVDAWRLGVMLGYSTELIGAFTFSPAERQRQAREIVAPMLARADAIAALLEVGPVDVLAVRTAQDFGNLTGRVEADESGIAARIQAKLSPRDRHLFLLGMHSGLFFASLEFGSEQSPLPSPQTALIARHATLAGAAPGLWQPLQRIPSGNTRAEIVAAYRAAMTIFEGALASGESTPAAAQAP